jgi:integrase
LGSVFRKTSVRPVPAGAKIIAGKNGTRVAKWTPKGAPRPITARVVTRDDGAQFVHVPTGCYYAKYRDHDQKVRTVSTGCKDKENANQFLRNLEKQTERVEVGVVTKDEIRRADQVKSVKLDAHIADYTSTLTGSKDHQKKTRRYLDLLKSALEWSTLADLRRDDLDLWLHGQFQNGRSARSCNGYRIAACGFCSWLVEAKRLASNPFSGLAKFDEVAGSRRPRRAMTPDELHRLIGAARIALKRPALKTARKTDRPADRFSGDDRADLYEFLAATGLRINEARELRVSDLSLEGNSPGLDLRAITTKNKQEGFIPFTPELVEMLRRRVEGRKPGAPVFDIPADLIKRFHADCKRAGIDRIDDRGKRVDLHALRKTFGTRLAMAGVPLTVAQRLMRHSDPKLTSNLYTDVRVLDLHGAVEAMAPIAPKVVARVVAKVVPTSGIPSHSQSTDVNKRTVSKKSRNAS